MRSPKNSNQLYSLGTDMLRNFGSPGQKKNPIAPSKEDSNQCFFRISDCSENAKGCSSKLSLVHTPTWMGMYAVKMENNDEEDMKQLES